MGVPANPRAWLISAGKFKAINAALEAARPPEAGTSARNPLRDEPKWPMKNAARTATEIKDDRLRLDLHLLAHPAIDPKLRVSRLSATARSAD